MPAESARLERLRRGAGRAACFAGSMLAVLLAPGTALAQDLTVFAASSLTEVMETVTARFQEETGRDVALSLAGSSVLARQIQQGAPADVFVSANAEWMDVLEADGMVAPDTRFDLLGNRLALVAHDRGVASFGAMTGDAVTALVGDARLAMALVDAVPAGIYGRAALQSLGAWETLAPRVVQADNVRAALLLVAAGEAPFGVVYATDAVAGDVAVAGLFPEDSHPPIVYPAAAVGEAVDPGARAFLDFLRSPEARVVFEDAGFTVLAGDE
jgi:molybdate transport system substrate-binding protein